MFIKHSVFYFITQGFSGLISFIALIVYTRLLTPDEFGRYSLVIAGAGLFNTVFFQWLKLSLLRYLPIQKENDKVFLSNIITSFLIIAVILGLLAFIYFLMLHDQIWERYILFGLLLIWSEGWFELNLELLRSKLKPIKYGILKFLKNLISLLFGIFFIYLLKIGALGPIYGILIGITITTLLLVTKEWKGLSLKLNRNIIIELLSYGLPLTGTFALSFIVNSSDRFFIAKYLNESAVGIYSATYDLVQQVMVLIMMVINLAGYPIIIKILETDGLEAAKKQLVKNGNFMFMISIPVTIGFVMLSNSISSTFLGSNFRDKSIFLMPMISVSILFMGIKAYFFDLVFQMNKNTIYQLFIMGIASVINIILNIFLIPRYELYGAALSTLISYLIALILSIYIGRKIMLLTIDYIFLLKVLFSAFIMSIILYFLPSCSNIWCLFVFIFISGIFYISSLLILNYKLIKIKINNFYNNKYEKY